MLRIEVGKDLRSQKKALGCDIICEDYLVICAIEVMPLHRPLSRHVTNTRQPNERLGGHKGRCRKGVFELTIYSNGNAMLSGYNQVAVRNTRCQRVFPEQHRLLVQCDIVKRLAP